MFDEFVWIYCIDLLHWKMWFSLWWQAHFKIFTSLSFDANSGFVSDVYQILHQLHFLFSHTARWGSLDSNISFPFLSFPSTFLHSLPSLPSSCCAGWALDTISPGSPCYTRWTWTPYRQLQMLWSTSGPEQHAWTRTHARENAKEDVRICIK